MIVALISSAEITIGFEQTSYPAMEDQGSVEVCTVVTSGSLQGDVIVTFSTQDGSAEGKVYVVRGKDFR